jgi:acyl-CoA hydrolase
LPKINFMDERIQRSKTTQTRIIFPGSLNDRDTLFGGIAMKWMDEVAYITATRFLRKETVTVAVENIKFLLPVNKGSIVEITGKVTEMGSVKIKVQVVVMVEDKNSDKQEKAIEADFWFAAIDENQNPIRITLVKNQEIVKN